MTGEVAKAARLGELLSMLRPVPEDWHPGKDGTSARGHAGGVKAERCTSWADLINEWRKAMLWTDGLDLTMSVMLSVAVSTDQAGDQLFLMVIGDAGSGKTRLCEGLLVSKHCYALEHLTGFHSGWQDGSGNDFSLLARINKKTLVTPEGDVLLSNPRFQEIMSQQRRIFDGSSSASYKNRKEDTKYEGLRTPWVIVGTPALLNTDQSRLGDRFLKVFVDPPSADTQADILRRVAFTALRAVKQQTNGCPSSIVEEGLRKAYAKTGGYIDFLRSDPEGLYGSVPVDEEILVHHCTRLAEFTACLRARPDPDTRKVKEAADHKEMPTRLTSQYVRLALSMGAVTQRAATDPEVLRRVTRVACDTSKGRTVEIVRYVARAGRDGLSAAAVAAYTGQEESEEKRFLKFLKRVGVVDPRPVKSGSVNRGVRWHLTAWFSQLYREVTSAESR